MVAGAAAAVGWLGGCVCIYIERSRRCDGVCVCLSLSDRLTRSGRSQRFPSLRETDGLTDLPEVVDGHEDEEDEEGALEDRHEPQEDPGRGKEEAGGAGEEDADLVAPVAMVWWGEGVDGWMDGV